MMHRAVVCGVLLSVVAAVGQADASSYADAVASIEKTPEAALELVRARMTFRPYRGFVKGPLAAWWDGTANGADAAELLLDVLRRKRIPARLAFGVLPKAHVDALLNSFVAGKPPAEVQKHLPGGPARGPLHDADLRRAAAQHVWVQARQGGKWVDLDAVVPGLKPGEAPAPVAKTAPAPTRADRRRLRVEVLGKTAKAGARPVAYLRHEVDVIDLVGGVLALGHQPADKQTPDLKGGPKGLRPVLIVDGRTVRGRPYGGQAPGAGGRLGGVFGRVGGAAPVAAEIAVRFTLTGGGKPDRTAKRHITLGGADGLNRLADLTVYTVAFGAPPATLIHERLTASPTLAELAKTVKLPKGIPTTPEEKKQAGLVLARTLEVAGGMGLWLARATHETLMLADRAYGTISDYDEPRLLGIAIAPHHGRLSTDLVFDEVVSWPCAGAKASAPVMLRSLRGRLNAELEGALLARFGRDGMAKERSVLSTGAIIRAAHKQGIRPAVLFREKPDGLEAVSCEPWVRAILAERVAAGRVIFVPTRPVRMAGWAKPVTAWYEIDRVTGAWNGVLQDGRHAAMTQDKIIRNVVALGAGWACTFIQSYMSTLSTYTFTRVGLLEDYYKTEAEIHEEALAAASSLDWFSGYLELFAVVMGAVTWNPGQTALCYTTGLGMLVAGQQAAIIFIRRRFKMFGV
ncbi:hypothetical protein HQ560_01510 [bacterium]|nr:hypothetical protein [bacterium]